MPAPKAELRLKQQVAWSTERILRKVIHACLTIVAIIVVVGCTVDAFGDEALFGVNRPRPKWLSGPAWQSELESMQRAGVRELRFPVTDPVDESIQSILAAARMGVHVLVSFNLNNPSFFPPGTKMRPGVGGHNSPFRLSDIDPKRVVAVWMQIRDALEREHLPFVGLEIGNEVDWADFNGDLTVGEGARLLMTKNDLAGAEGQKILTGFDRLMQIVSVINTADPKRSYPVVVGGLVSVVSDGQPRAMSAIQMNLAIKLLEERGVARLANGISFHVYPAPVIRGKTDLQCQSWPAQWLPAMQYCRRSAQPGLSCWITETGTWTAGTACEPQGERGKDFFCMHSGFVSLNRTYKIDRVYIFAWQGTVPFHAPFSLFRNGALCGEAKEFFSGK
jgi:hypothetical protein